MNDVGKAVEILRAGGLVAFPTETVYGLGADATNASAVLKIFAAKGRPATNPLIIHVANELVARRYAATWPEAASRLARRFWPGPLTLVLPKEPAIVPQATAGLGTLGLRCPDHPLALQLLQDFDGPLAAPSANRSTRVSPTTAQHVRDELGDAVDCILDGGPCRVGIESTVLSLCQARPIILRPGAVSARMIEEEIGPVEHFVGHVSPNVPAASPGQHFKHYSPTATTYRFDRSQSAILRRWREEHAGQPWAIIVIGPVPAELSADTDCACVVQMPEDPTDYAQRLYATLRDLDARHLGTLWIEMPPTAPEWTAIRDRLTRATRDSGLF